MEPMRARSAPSGVVGSVCKLLDRPARSWLRYAMPEPRVVLYATSDCPHCAAARAALRAAGESFDERDPSTSAEVFQELLSFAASAVVPTIVVGGTALVGFDQDRLTQMLLEPRTELGEVNDYTDEELNGSDEDLLLPE